MKKTTQHLVIGIVIGLGLGIGSGAALVFHNVTPLLQEYQIRVEMDSAYVYDHGRLVGSCPHGIDGIDSLILNDNQ